MKEDRFHVVYGVDSQDIEKELNHPDNKNYRVVAMTSGPWFQRVETGIGHEILDQTSDSIYVLLERK